MKQCLVKVKLLIFIIIVAGTAARADSLGTELKTLSAVKTFLLDVADAPEFRQVINYVLDAQNGKGAAGFSDPAFFHLLNRYTLVRGTEMSYLEHYLSTIVPHELARKPIYSKVGENFRYEIEWRDPMLNLFFNPDVYILTQQKNNNLLPENAHVLIRLSIQRVASGAEISLVDNYIGQLEPYICKEALAVGAPGH